MNDRYQRLDRGGNDGFVGELRSGYRFCLKHFRTEQKRA